MPPRRSETSNGFRSGGGLASARWIGVCQRTAVAHDMIGVGLIIPLAGAVWGWELPRSAGGAHAGFAPSRRERCCYAAAAGIVEPA